MFRYLGWSEGLLSFGAFFCLLKIINKIRFKTFVVKHFRKFLFVVISFLNCFFTQNFNFFEVSAWFDSNQTLSKNFLEVQKFFEFHLANLIIWLKSIPINSQSVTFSILFERHVHLASLFRSPIIRRELCRIIRNWNGRKLSDCTAIDYKPV